jgi:hypothetical protein
MVSHTMSAVRPCEVPRDCLLCRYQGGAGFADCYVIEVHKAVTQAAFVEAFYTSPLFKIERTLLKYLASSPATDDDVKRLATGSVSRFSAWTVESQSASELLLADVSGNTRSWLRASPVNGPDLLPSTRLYFGSAVVARSRSGGRSPGVGWLFHALSGFHRIYSRLLLSAAARRVGRQ